MTNIRSKLWIPRIVMKWTSMEMGSQATREPHTLNLTVDSYVFRVCVCRCLGEVEIKLLQSRAYLSFRNVSVMEFERNRGEKIS